MFGELVVKDCWGKSAAPSLLLLASSSHLHLFLVLLDRTSGAIVADCPCPTVEANLKQSCFLAEPLLNLTPRNRDTLRLCVCSLSCAQRVLQLMFVAVTDSKSLGGNFEELLLGWNREF